MFCTISHLGKDARWRGSAVLAAFHPHPFLLLGWQEAFLFTLSQMKTWNNGGICFSGLRSSVSCLECYKTLSALQMHAALCPLHAHVSTKNPFWKQELTPKLAKSDSPVAWGGLCPHHHCLPHPLALFSYLSVALQLKWEQKTAGARGKEERARTSSGDCGTSALRLLFDSPPSCLSIPGRVPWLPNLGLQRLLAAQLRIAASLLAILPRPHKSTVAPASQLLPCGAPGWLLCRNMHGRRDLARSSSCW